MTTVEAKDPDQGDGGQVKYSMQVGSLYYNGCYIFSGPSDQ